MINTIIIEDNIENCEYLSKILQNNFPEITLKGTAKSVKNGIKLIEEKSPDIIFLDIELEDGLAFEILDTITEKKFEVIFTTAHNNYYEKAIEHFAFSYLLKPINIEKLKKTIERYQTKRAHLFSKEKYSHFKEMLKNNSPKILINTGYKHISISIDNIVSCKAENNYTLFTLNNNEKILASNGLKYYDDLLGFKGFFRANRSCLVNISHITTIIKKETIILSNNDKINISIRNRSKLSDLIDTLS